MKRILIFVCLAVLNSIAALANAPDQVLREYRVGEAIIYGNRLTPDPVLQVIMTSDSTFCFKRSDGSRYPIPSVNQPRPQAGKPLIVTEENSNISSLAIEMIAVGRTALQQGANEAAVLTAMLDCAKAKPLIARVELRPGSVFCWTNSGKFFAVNPPSTMSPVPPKVTTNIQTFLEELDNSLGKGGICLVGSGGYKILVPACHASQVLKEINCAREILQGAYQPVFLQAINRRAVLEDMVNPKPVVQKKEVEQQ